MNIFPDVDPRLMKAEDRPIREMMETAYADCISYEATRWSNATFCNRFYMGDQSAFRELGYNNQGNQKKQFYFNRIRPIVSMITGNQRKNRKSTIITPIESGDDVTADQFTKLMSWNDQREGVRETISEAFEGACISGMNLLNPWMDYRSDPISGDLRVDRLDACDFMIDPFYKKQNLSDCSYVWKRSYLSRDEARSLLPGKDTEIDGVNIMYAGDGKFQYLPENRMMNQSKLNTYDEFYYKKFRTQKLIVDTQTNDTFEWQSVHDDKLREFLNLFPQLTVRTTEVPAWDVAIMLNGVCMYQGVQPSGLSELPFVPVYSYYNPNVTNISFRVQSVVTGLIDAQYLFNRRRTIELSMLESQINSGWKFKAEALVNPKDVFLSGEGRGLAIKQNASMDDVQQIIPNGIHPSVLQLSENLGREMERISGVSEEALGQAIDDKAGILAMLRANATITVLQGLFDQLDRSQKLLGTLRLKLIQKNFTPTKVQRILAEEPADEFYHKNFSSYDCAVEDGFDTTTQRQQQFVQLLHLKEIGVQIPDDVLVEAATIQNKKKLTDRLAAQSQQAQDLQSLQLQTQMQETEARTALAHARAMADTGLGYERQSRVSSNESMAIERRAKAASDENQSILNLVKALKEIDKMDIEHIEKLLSLQQMVKGQEAVIEQEAQPQNDENLQKSLI